jgi:hypothetical protein
MVYPVQSGAASLPQGIHPLQIHCMALMPPMKP